LSNKISGERGALRHVVVVAEQDEWIFCNRKFSYQKYGHKKSPSFIYE